MQPSYRKILLVDNASSWDSKFAEIMRSLGVEVHTTDRFEQLIPNIREYEVLVFDNFFASVKYRDALRKVNRSYPDKPIVVVCVAPNAEDAKNAFEQGACEFIDANCEWDTIVPRVIEHLNVESEPGQDGRLTNEYKRNNIAR